ncbi:alpha-galactosidase [Lysinibacter sp. HNR]|uniref:alpha-galactosidase n=1 Tax=Lysinibacter sp. HNR TaxID=3031408 RepID=UPI0024354C0F|nr:alpha-galactosidase [Lysinibacter sp. HNR]WGD36979.1 alpha-galactosidase [Lysinibacter sp. HNR]
MIAYLRAAGTSLVLDARGTTVPSVTHWGADLGELSTEMLASMVDAGTPSVGPSSIDVPFRVSLLPRIEDGWVGRQGVTGFRADGSGLDLTLRLDPVAPVETVGGEQVLRLVMSDTTAELAFSTEIRLSPEGILRLRHDVTNLGAQPWFLGELSATLPLPERAQEILDFTGLWTHERRPQRTPLNSGAWSRATAHGRPGHDDPFLLAVGTKGFGFRSGEVWSCHLAWSGDKHLWAENQSAGHSLLGSGENLAAGEIVLNTGERYRTPWTVAAWSGTGIDGLSARFHPFVRRLSPLDSAPPVTLNTWEAVYFDHDLPVLKNLVDLAARVGVERFVLDDGWFTGRTDDRRALGDWTIDATKWPDGLTPLCEYVITQGMQFGLWVEPEMISADSELAREHPDWVLGQPSAIEWRFQRVLNLAVPEAFEYVLGRLRALLDEYPISYLKWDHNRDLLSPRSHRQTIAFYQLLDAIRESHPSVQLESCASGGGRIDLGVLQWVHRVWTSDTNDPLERQAIQRYTGILIPPEFLGGHLGAERAHTTQRRAQLSFRLATALFGSAGIEWDLAEASEEELATVANWIALYKKLDQLITGGTAVRVDPSDPAVTVSGIVSADQRTALFAEVALDAPRRALPAPVRFEGLNPELLYRVTPLLTGEAPLTIQDAPPAWLAAGSVTLTGRQLAEVGLRTPLLAPENAALWMMTAL